MVTNKTPWVILLILWMMGSTWWHVCKIKQLCFGQGQPGTSATENGVYTTPSGADGFDIADGNYFRLSFPRNVSFAKSGANVNLNSLGAPIDPLITYLKANPKRTLEIIGYYTSAETNTTSLPSLGLARAEGMKQYLVEQGVAEASLTTQGTERNLPATAKGDSLIGGLGFVFGGAEPVTGSINTDTELTVNKPAEASTTGPIVMTGPVTETDLAESQKFTSVFKPIDLYFKLGASSYIKTGETRKFFEEAAKILIANPGKKLLLTGHTDDRGPDEANERLSLNRANDVKARLRKSGIKPDQIEVQAKGESEPKADNSTSAGRKANRRVTVVVLN